ncbi:MAG TPA: hypothetical protein VIY47_10820, partial [Ignavibacteriaceae bacterium]
MLKKILVLSFFFIGTNSFVEIPAKDVPPTTTTANSQKIEEKPPEEKPVEPKFIFDAEKNRLIRNPNLQMEND